MVNLIVSLMALVNADRSKSCFNSTRLSRIRDQQPTMKMVCAMPTSMRKLQAYRRRAMRQSIKVHFCTCLRSCSCLYRHRALVCPSRNDMLSRRVLTMAWTTDYGIDEVLTASFSHGCIPCKLRLHKYTHITKECEKSFKLVPILKSYHFLTLFQPRSKLNGTT